MSENEIARRDRLEYMINMMKGQIAALDTEKIHTVAVGSGEVSISFEAEQTPKEVIEGLRKMLQDKIANYEKELHEQRG